MVKKRLVFPSHFIGRIKVFNMTDVSHVSISSYRINYYEDGLLYTKTTKTLHTETTRTLHTETTTTISRDH